LQWIDYYWVYLFAFSIGFSTTIAEPSLIAVAIKANQVSGGAISVNGLRMAVALLPDTLWWLFRPFLHHN